MSTYADAPPFSRPGRAALVTLVYVLLIPLINWSFTWAPMMALPGLGDRSLSIHPLSDEHAAREINLTVRRAFPRQALITRIADAIRDTLPDSVIPA